MNPETASAREYEFAGFRLDPAARQLTTLAGAPVNLTSRAFDTLTCLVSRAGAIVAKRVLLREVWAEVVVGDNNLNQAIAAIRRALGDSSEPRHIIRTIPGRGFCCVAEVQVREKRRPAREPNQREPIVTVADYF